MKTLRLIIFFLSLCVSIPLCSQERKTIIDELETDKPGEGTIEVESAPEITALLGTPSRRAHLDGDNYTMSKVSGFRILAYMGSDQRKARGQASSRQTQIRESFPEIETYLTYESPNWKLFVGDFITQDEANAFKQLIQKEFPQFGKEMYIVSAIVNIPTEK